MQPAFTHSFFYIKPCAITTIFGEMLTLTRSIAYRNGQK
jgi:hypothetical protein